MSSVADFIRRNPERARGLEQMTSYVPYLFVDGMSLVQSQAALTVSRLASLTVAVCLHDNPSIQRHIASLQRELNATTGIVGSNRGPHASGSSSSPARGANATTVTTRTASPMPGSASSNQADDEADVPEGHPNVASLTGKYNDPRSRSLIAHYKRSVAAELGVLFLSEVEVLLELLVRSNGFQSVLASHGYGACLSGGGQSSASSPSLLSALGAGQTPHRHAIIPPKVVGPSSSHPPTGAVEGRIRKLITGSKPLPSTATLHQRSRRAGWILCWTVTLIKSILRLYMQRSTLSLAARSLLTHLRQLLDGMSNRVMRATKRICGRTTESAAPPTAYEQPGVAFSEDGAREASPCPAEPNNISAAAAVAPRNSLDGGNLQQLGGCAAGRAPSAGLVIPRVAGGFSSSSQSLRASPSRRLLQQQHGNADATSTTLTTTDAPNNVYLFTLKEYLAVLIDAFHATKPFIWTVIACVSRNSSRPLALTRSLRRSTEFDTTAIAAMSASVPRLFLPSWRGWCLMMGLEGVSFAVSVWLKLSRHPVVIVGGNANHNRGEELSSAAPLITSASTTSSSVCGGINNLPTTQEKDHERVWRSVRNLCLATLQDPFFAVVLKDVVVANFVEGGFGRVPIIGGIIGAQMMMYMLRRDASFLASNF